MSILIKGIEMPKGCNVCPFNIFKICLINTLQEGKYTVTHSCPLVEVPPHGRLIDADVLSQIYRFDDYGKAVVDCEDIDNAPTIIEAEVDDG